MSDLIKRSDAINVLEGLSACEEHGVEVGINDETYIGKYEAITAISDLPSADRPSMEWKEDKDGQIRCTNCGRVAEWNFFEDEYCPRCGAKRED